jgi:hypothetical protein
MERAMGSPEKAEEPEPALSVDLASCFSDEALIVFRHLPARDQRNFIRWVDAGRSAPERHRRGVIVRGALDLSALAWESRPRLPNNPG